MFNWLKPGLVIQWVNRLLPLFTVLAVLCFAGGVYMAFFTSPPDYQQGESVRIMYIHVPAASMSLFIYCAVAAASASSLIWRNPISDIIGISAAPIGACFTLITLITGSLWGKPIWGAWWVWDARLTSVLILFFFYIGYIALFSAFENSSRGAKAAAILSLVGLINVPIVKFSVDWWNTLHQPASLLRLDGPAIHPSMAIPLTTMFAAFLFYFLAALCIRVKAGLLERKIIRLQMGM